MEKNTKTFEKILALFNLDSTSSPHEYFNKFYLQTRCPRFSPSDTRGPIVYNAMKKFPDMRRFQLETVLLEHFYTKNGVEIDSSVLFYPFEHDYRKSLYVLYLYAIIELSMRDNLSEEQRKRSDQLLEMIYTGVLPCCVDALDW